MRLKPPLCLKLRGFAGARRTSGHEVDLPTSFARRAINPLDLFRLVCLELQPPLRCPADALPDAFHRFSGQPSRRGIRGILRRASLDLASGLTKRLVEVREDAVDVESHPDAHARVFPAAGAVSSRSIGRTAIAATMAASRRLAGARRPASQRLWMAMPARPAHAPILR